MTLTTEPDREDIDWTADGGIRSFVFESVSLLPFLHRRRQGDKPFTKLQRQLMRAGLKKGGTGDQPPATAGLGNLPSGRRVSLPGLKSGLAGSRRPHSSAGLVARRNRLVACATHAEFSDRLLKRRELRAPSPVGSRHSTARSSIKSAVRPRGFHSPDLHSSDFSPRPKPDP